MQIGIIGAGNVGTGLGKRLALQGHEIVVSFARTIEKVTQAAATIGSGARAGTPEEAVKHGDVVILATPWGVTLDAVQGLAEALDGKILWDCTNPLVPDLTGLAIGTTTSGGEEIARLAPGARVVKGIPPMAELLHSPDPLINGRPVSLFVAGDDQDAKRQVSELMSTLPSKVTDAGGLSQSRFIEPAMMLLVRLAYAQGFGSRVSLDVRTEL